MFGRKKGVDLSHILTLQRLIDAEIKSLQRKEQGNYDAAVRNVGAAVQQKNKSSCITIGKRAFEAKRKVEIIKILAKQIQQIKPKSDEISKGTRSADVDEMMTIICCCADIFKTDGLVKFKTTVVKEAFKSCFKELITPEKLGDPIKTLLAQKEPSQEEIISLIRSDCQSFCRDPGAIEALFGAAVQQPPQPQPKQQPRIEAKIPLRAQSLSSIPHVRKYKENENIFTPTSNEPFPRESWPKLLASIKSVAH